MRGLRSERETFVYPKRKAKILPSYVTAVTSRFLRRITGSNPILLMREKVNSILANIDYEFQGSVEVRHLIDILYNDVGPEKVKESVEVPLTGVNVAIHYGCHLLKPKFDRTFGSSERPRFFDELVEALGATSIDYKEKMMCCGAGGGVRSYKMDLALDIANEKLYT